MPSGSRVVAVCIAGEPRNYATGGEVIKQLRADNPQCRFDVFLHLWHSENVTAYVSKRAVHHVDIHLPETLQKLFEAVQVTVTDPDSFQPQWHRSAILPDTPQEHERQYYGKQVVRNSLKSYVESTHTPYDLVISARYDMLFPIQLDLEQVDSRNVYLGLPPFPLQPMIPNDNITVMNYPNYLKVYNFWSDYFHRELDNFNIPKHLSKWTGSAEIIFSTALHKHGLIQRCRVRDQIPDFAVDIVSALYRGQRNFILKWLQLLPGWLLGLVTRALFLKYGFII